MTAWAASPGIPREHLELYFAVPAVGAILHTINIRISPDDVRYIVEDAGDGVVFYDHTLASDMPNLADIVATRVQIGDGDSRPDGVLAFEDLVEAGDPSFEFSVHDEDTAAVLCYTSGTTGRPKGVAYTHRSICLYALMANQPDAFGIRESDVVMPVVPMFHANAWGFPYIAAMTGASLVLPGPAPTADTLAELIRTCGVTVAAAVPTVLQGLLDVASADDVRTVRELICGGAAVPETLIRAYDDKFGIKVVQGWGMTETSPLAAISRDMPAADARPGRDLSTAGTAGPSPAVPRCAHRRRRRRELQLRGPTITARYHHDVASSSFTDDGWLRTGDIAEVDDQHYIKLIDRTKDLVKSGGEWISSVELETAALFHPGIAEAAVVARQDAKWGERPHMFVVRTANANVTAEDLRGVLLGKFPRWWMPDVIEFVEAIPKTSVGKIDKKELRTILASHDQPEPAAKSPSGREDPSSTAAGPTS